MLKLFLCSCSILLSGCLPTYLGKYAGNVVESEDVSRKIRKEAGNKIKPIYPIASNKYRFHQKYEQVWESALGVLLANYNIAIVNKESGVITTEWDTFYLNKKVYRNKITLFIKHSSWGLVDVMIYNNVETLGSEAFGSKSTWFPDTQEEKESSRIIRNMAISLNQPPPDISSKPIARSQTSKKIAN